MSPRPLVIPALTLLLACTSRPSGDTATEGGDDSTGSTGSTDADPTLDPGTASEPDPSATAGPTTSGPGPTTSGPEPTTSGGTDTPEPPPPDPDPRPGQPCDIWAEDCPEGHKCMPASLDGDNSWETTICAPVVDEPAGLDEPCQNLGTGLDGLDTCDVHMMCWGVDPDTGEGVCFGLCTGTPDAPGCADPDAACQITGEGVVNLCLPTCDPVEETCADGQECLPSPSGDEFVCIPEFAGQDGEAFEPCEFVSACDPGLACVPSSLAPACDPMQPSCCLPFCDLDGPDTCPGQDLECAPWFEEGQAPPGLEHVGLCVQMT